MKKIKFSRAIGTLMAVVTLAACFCTNPVFAAELDKVEAIEQQVETEGSIMPYAGRKVQIYTELYSIKDYIDTMERSVLFTNYRSYVSN